MKLILTKELGRLARWLRIIGFDVLYELQGNRSSVIMMALKEDRVIVTRGHSLTNSCGIKVINISREGIKEQLGEVLKALKISLDSDKMFTRCIICNEELSPVTKEAIRNNVPEYVFQTQDNFVCCPKCGRIYWRGTHWGNVKGVLEDIGNGVHS